MKNQCYVDNGQTLIILLTGKGTVCFLKMNF